MSLYKNNRLHHSPNAMISMYYMNTWIWRAPASESQMEAWWMKEKLCRIKRSLCIYHLGIKWQLQRNNYLKNEEWSEERKETAAVSFKHMNRRRILHLEREKNSREARGKWLIWPTRKKETKKIVYWKLEAKRGHREQRNQLFISKWAENTKVLKDHLTYRTDSRGWSKLMMCSNSMKVKSRKGSHF